jgi:hypothetical protein
MEECFCSIQTPEHRKMRTNVSPRERGTVPQPNNSDIYIHRRWICADERLSIRENGRRLEFFQISEVVRYLPPHVRSSFC